MRKLKTMNQVGAICFGVGMNARYWIEHFKARGFAVVLCGDYAELWK